MIFLPEQSEFISCGLEKLDTYVLLSKMGCPVFKSIIISPLEQINSCMVKQMRDYFKTEDVTVRFQYIKPTMTPVLGGNRCKLELNEISSLQNSDTILWLLEPINRLKNDYGINLHFNNNHCYIEIVGKGFDVSDLNRGQISPHQEIDTELPIRWGEYGEWWKFLKFTFCNPCTYKNSIDIRMQKLKTMGYNVSLNIFNKIYQPLPFEKLELLVVFIEMIYNKFEGNDFCVSCSIINGRFVFWDIQTPCGKKKIYGVN